MRVTGKNVPLNRNIGVTAKRKSGLNTSSSAHADSAEMGAANASPTSTQSGIVRIDHQECSAPNAASATR
jgi:hypothetical protein